MAPEDDELAAEVAEETEEHPEPQTVGHTVVQDNVSEPGVQHTHQVAADGTVLQTSSHDEAEAALPAEEPTGEVESDSALVGAGPGDDDGQGGGADADQE